MADKIDNGGQAFPSEHVVFEPIGTDGLMQGKQRPLPGMTLRDWFAGQSLLSCASFWSDAETRRTYAKRAYQMADALILARKGER